MRRRGAIGLEVLVALPLAALALGGAWLTFSTGARQGAATAALTDLLSAEVRVRGPLENDLGSLVTDGEDAACTLAPDGRRLELRTLADVPPDASARLRVRAVRWEIAPARAGGWNVVRDGRVLSSTPFASAQIAVQRRDRVLTVSFSLADAAGRALEIGAMHEAALGMPGLARVLD